MTEETKTNVNTQHTRRIQQIQVEISAAECDLTTLRSLVWHGVDCELRSYVWQLLIGYLPVTLDRRAQALERKRNEYLQYRAEIYEERSQHQTEKHLKDLKQIEDDIPRTQPDVPMFRDEPIREVLRRILYIWSVRHPASGYVQGINDLCSIFLIVFMMPYCSFRILAEPGSLPENMDELEADAYWCLNIMVESIQDYFFPSSPGIQRALIKISEIIFRVKQELIYHFKGEQLEMIHFSFRWFNCMFIREFSLPMLFRVWDALFTMQDGFRILSVYIAAAIVLRWEKELIGKNFSELMIFLQNLPTSRWTEREIEELLSQSYVYFTWFESSPNHLKA
ncbi:unnamed protein product [Blepharisma stoltei]|uniref:Rab-GAP TBC domain-containing protein n=1 Tax=Blepharisma stoltei TaxID=1481888 RepID=A0AAU9IGV8_9CILI|nr:unnamed protein product [Blepharisma stoltei]